MDNQHKLIKGYRDLSEQEITLMNEIKEKGAEIEELINKLRTDQSVDPRWLAIGQTDMQTGLMALTRAVAKPSSF